MLKYIFTDGLGGHLDEILQLASEVLQQPSGMEMVMALLRYISRSAVKLDKAEITQKLLAHLPKEGGVLMETLAQAWIEEGKLIGFDIGKKEGIEEGIEKGIEKGIEQGKLEAQRQTLFRLLQWRFSPTAAEVTRYAAQLERIDKLEELLHLLDQLLVTPTLGEFVNLLPVYTPTDDAQ